MFASVVSGSLRFHPGPGSPWEGQRRLPPGFAWLFGLVGGIPVPQDPVSRAAVVAPWPTKGKVFEAAFSNFFTASRRSSRAGDPGPVRANISAKHRNPCGHVKPPRLESSPIWVSGFLKRRLFGLQEVTKLTRPPVEKR
jgi:hypothetical protein